MHIHTQHRHFVLLPVLGLVLLMSVSGAQRADIGSGGIMTASASEDRSLVVDGMHVIPDSDAKVEWKAGITLAVGSVLAGGGGRITLQAGEAVITAFHGAMHVTAAEGKVTVAALTSPVVVRVGAARVVVPIGMQADVRTDRETDLDEQIYQPLPDGFARTQTKRLGALDSGPYPPSEYIRPFFPEIAFLQLPAARERARLAYQKGLISDIARAASTGDGVHVQAYLREVDQTIYTSVSAWSDALAAAVGHPSIVAAILPQVQSADLQLLAFFHPDLRLSAWAQDLTGRKEALVRPALMLLPLDDLGGEALPPFVVDRWKADVAQFLPAQAEPGAFLSPLLWRMELTRKTAAARGYPERLQRYSDAVQALTQPFMGALPPSTAGLVQTWQQTKAETVAVVTEPVQPVADESSSSDASVAAEAQASSAAASPPLTSGQISDLERETAKAFVGAGALFRMDATLHAKALDRTEVTGVVIGSPSGDHAFDFSYDVGQKMVSNIVRDGQSFPYALPLDGFMMWAKSGE
jgi:hypothetical protein